MKQSERKSGSARRWTAAMMCAFLVTACQAPQGVVDAGEDEQNAAEHCVTEIGPNGEISSSCDYGLQINGVERGDTNTSIKLQSARGAGGSVSATTTFTGAVMRPDGGVLKVTISDEGGYELDAGADGKLQVKPAEIDPEDPEAAIDAVSVTMTSSSGLTKSHTVTCPGLFSFANEIEESGSDPVPGTNCPDSLSKPDASSGCFPCEALGDLISGHGIFVDPDLRARAVVMSDISTDLYKMHGGGERAEVVIMIVMVIVQAVVNTIARHVACSSYSDGFGCDMPTSSW